MMIISVIGDLKEERKYGRLGVCVLPAQFIVDEILEA